MLESAVEYALGSAALVTPQLLSRPTPCAGWDLYTLLNHLSDSIATLQQTITTTHIGLGASACGAPEELGPETDPVARLRCEAARLLADYAAAGPAPRAVAIGDRRLTATMIAVTGALEITVHGWDIAVACGMHRPVPPGLAAVLLLIAPLLVTPTTRPGLFADPVRLRGPASASDHLVAYLGRNPAPLHRLAETVARNT